MSHNINKINNSKPNSSGEITQSLNDLNDVSASSPVNGNGLIYNSSSSSWVASALGGSGGIINIGQGQQNTYNNSGASTIGVNTDIYFYDTSPTNTISGSTVTKYSSTDWVQSVTLPAGDYIVWARYCVEFSSTGYMTYALFDSSNNQISSYAAIGADTSTHAFSPSVLQSRIVLTSSTSIKLRSIAVSGVNSVSNQGNTPAEHSQLTIVKL